MISDEDLAGLRFGMTELPSSGGKPGDYEERLTQWFLERSFFRDFTYRNPAKRRGEELADAVVLFDDVAFQTRPLEGWCCKTSLDVIK